MKINFKFNQKKLGLKLCQIKFVYIVEIYIFTENAQEMS